MTKEHRIPTCPSCGTNGKVVRPETLLSLLRAEHQDRVTEGRYRFCGSPDCEVVYFAEDGSHVFHRPDLTVRVGVKETDAPRPICYCFGFTAEELYEQIRQTGSTTVPDQIRTRLEQDGCHCERTNPQGSCCLGVVQVFAEAGMKRFGDQASRIRALLRE
jgi:hypothetical protein